MDNMYNTEDALHDIEQVFAPNSLTEEARDRIRDILYKLENDAYEDGSDGVIPI